MQNRFVAGNLMRWLTLRAFDQHRYRVSIYDTWQFYEGRQDDDGNYPVGQVASGRALSIYSEDEHVVVRMDNGSTIKLDPDNQDPLLCWARDDRTETWYDWIKRQYPTALD